MNEKMLIEIDKDDLINLILGVDDDLYYSSFIDSLPQNLQKYGMWSNAGWGVYWHWCSWKLDEATFEELAKLYKLIKTLK